MDVDTRLQKIEQRIGLINRNLSFNINELAKRLDSFESKMEMRFDKVITHLVSIAGQFKKFDEERVVLAERSKNHEDRIEKLERATLRAS